MANMAQESEVETTSSEAQNKLERAIWFFRTGNLTAWNYTILALAICGLFLGIFLLVRNIQNNRKRKMAMCKNKGSDVADKDENKQAEVHLEKIDSVEEGTLLNEKKKPGDIIVQWKDGRVDSLFPALPEHDV
ncbi:hypothetical protein GDO86_006478 [Hymenochirus boettgeri]|uniref:Organic solute transporter subunit beta n=1 Tax=Hymenochirus boettgeri TaxID=247094 RepID=A0A8T2JBU0_9PIPI|nr:hypothetical protein GDO86_006478 [Hymenochirus boettgeri]